jgi:ferredoxin
MTVKVWVDPDKCMGHGMCTAMAPELFHVNQETGLNEMGEAEIRPELEQLAKRGIGACPEQAISVVEEHRLSGGEPRGTQ